MKHYSPYAPLIDRLMDNLEWRGDCLEWTASKAKNGYGSLSYQGKKHVVTRLVMSLQHGPLPTGTHVLHRCDNPPCCNPDHLFLGTPSDNIRDAISKGRFTGHVRAGATNHKVRHTDEQVAEARARVAAGESISSVARGIGASRITIRRWVRGSVRNRPSGLYLVTYQSSRDAA